jgi:hypothetical protein
MYFEEPTHDPVSSAFSAEIYKNILIILKKERKNKMHTYCTSLGQYRNRQHRKFVYEVGVKKECYGTS